VLARLDEPGGSAMPAAGMTAPIVPGMVVSMPPVAGSEPSGPPRTNSVQTVPIGRDGNPIVGQQQPVTPRGLPGVQIDNSLNAPAPCGSIPTADTQPAAPAGKPAPQRLAAAPAAATDAASDAPVGAQPQPKARKVPVPKAPKEATAPPAGVGAAPAAGGGGGYVAVLTSQKDRAAALRIYADLAQKYPGQLGNRQPEVQEANLGDKGVWQRLVVGPPSSQQSAKELCAQLKAAGMGGDCWAKQY
jgi:SPOR domain